MSDGGSVEEVPGDPIPPLLGEPSWSDLTWREGGALIRPIREDDLDHLRRWRNAQQSVLRQQSPLDDAHQQAWYRDVVLPDQRSTRPSSLLVVVEAGGGPIGYGGLVHVDWSSGRGELSYLASTERAQDEEVYEADLRRFVAWLLRWTFRDLGFRKVSGETWSFRERHIEILEGCGFVREGLLRQHVVKDGVVHDAVVHGLLADDWRTTVAQGGS